MLALLNETFSDNAAPCSPTTAFDFSSFLDLDQEFGSSFLKLYGVPSMCAPEVRPLNSITAPCSSDLDSLSSSISKSQDQQSKKRSIFAKYWESIEDPPMVLTRCNHRAPQKSPPTTRSVSTGEHEYVEDHPHGPLVQPERLLKSPERRSIFGSNHEYILTDSTRSLPNMHLLPRASSILGQKASSSSALMDRPPSILRGGQQNGIRKQRRRSSSVSFDEKIDVVIFESPQESWSADGWSKFFDF